VSIDWSVVLEFDMLWIVESLRDAVMNNNVAAVRHLLAAENHSTVRPLPPERDKMTLVMLAARHGQLIIFLLSLITM